MSNYTSDSVTLRFADMLLTAYSFSFAEKPGDELKPAGWRVICHDTHTGQTETGEFSDKEFNAMMILAIAGETELLSEEVTENAYEILKYSAMKHWRSEVRPIP